VLNIRHLIEKYKWNLITEFDDTDMTALLIAFYLAGFDNTSSAATFALLELALNPEVQRKVHLEIDEFLTQTNGNVTYNALREMKYLEWVLYGKIS
jgi:cytochrome P450